MGYIDKQNMHLYSYFHSKWIHIFTYTQMEKGKGIHIFTQNGKKTKENPSN